MREALLALALLASPAIASAAPCGTLVLPANLTFGPPNPANTFHPVLSTGTFSEQNGIDLLFRPLVWIGQDDRIDPSQGLAASIVADADDRRFTVTLRPWHWSDGTAVTSADVLYTWHLIRQLGAAYVNFGLGGVPQDIRDVAAPDPHTVVFTLDRTVNPDWFEQLGITDFTPLPAHAWSSIPLATQQTRQGEASFYRVVDGPFHLESLMLGRYAAFVRNRRYDGHQPDYERLVIDFLAGADPLEALRAHALDAAFLPFDLRARENRLGDWQRVALGSQGSLDTIILDFRNRSVPFLRELAVRRAMARAIDQKRIVATVFAGETLPQYGFVATARTDQLPPELRNGASPLAYDPAGARAALDAAGWRAGPDGIRARDGQRLAFTMLVDADFTDGIKMAQLVETDLRAVGIAVDLREMAFTQLIARLSGPADGWQTVLMNWGGAGYPDGTQWFASTSSFNFGGWNDPPTDRLLADATAHAGDGPLFALERHIVAAEPMLFLPDGDPTLLARRGIGGFARLAGPGGEFSPENLTLPARMRCDAPHA